MAEVGGALLFIFWVFVIAVAILAFLLPIFVLQIRNTQRRNAELLADMAADVRTMSSAIARLAESQEKALKLQLIARKAREADARQGERVAP